MPPDRQNEFLEALWDFYAHHGRDLPWRRPGPDGGFDPYEIMVSELMLQQTQVPRVIPKYREFLQRFPTVQALARADLGDVLRAWQGLGYNRRAKFLHEAAKLVYNLNYFPDTLEGLVKLPGIGINTAGAILAYAYNRPAVFIETNIRTVYIHHFFADVTGIPDTAIRGLLEQTLDLEHPREFYWALMDYGSHLKTIAGNPNKASKHYAKQPKFDGSRRQVRGQIIRLLGTGSRTLPQLREAIEDSRLESVLQDLVHEGMVRSEGGAYSL
ncbi:MAG TPA: hypothetical protein VGM08_01220 [Candidatus Saccharimonadales bacterium]|jgi:A/G-specific adenine glycosylase